MNAPLASTFDAPALPLAHPLARPELHRALKSYVRRHVPRDEVPDVVQTVLCDALAAPSRPHDDVGLLKFVYTIAHRRVVDWHRRGGREQKPSGCVEPHVLPEVEQRSLLSWLERHAPLGSERARTLEWIAREAEGDSLEQIARAEQLPAACVRQRVSRLRRTFRKLLRAEIALPVLLVLGAGAIAGFHLSRDLSRNRAQPSALEIAPEGNRAAEAALSAELQGEWRLVAITPAPSVNPLRRALANAQPGKLVIRVVGRTAELRGPALRANLTTWLHATTPDAFSVIADVNGESVRFRARRDGDTLWLDSDSRAWAGSARLERVAR